MEHFPLFALLLNGLQVSPSATGFPVFLRNLSGASKIYSLLAYPRHMPVRSYIEVRAPPSRVPHHIPNTTFSVGDTCLHDLRQLCQVCYHPPLLNAATLTARLATSFPFTKKNSCTRLSTAYPTLRGAQKEANSTCSNTSLANLSKRTRKSSPCCGTTRKRWRRSKLFVRDTFTSTLHLRGTRSRICGKWRAKRSSVPA